MTCCDYDPRGDEAAADAWYAAQGEPACHVPVIPERTSLEFVRATAEHQAAGIVIGAACPTCGCGVVTWGETQCERCMGESRDRITADVAEFRAEIRRGLP